MSKNLRSGRWFWFLLIGGLIVGYSAVIAVTTHDTACARPDSPKHWVFFPPGWECERPF